MRHVFHFTSGNFFVFKPVPYSLNYAVKFFTLAKDRYIKHLEMENELMRDFLSLTERK